MDTTDKQNIEQILSILHIHGALLVFFDGIIYIVTLGKTPKSPISLAVLCKIKGWVDLFLEAGFVVPQK